MIQRVLMVRGTVQKVGYREAVHEIATDHGVVGTVKNLPDRTVEITCQGVRSVINDFTGAVIIRDEYIHVDSVGILSEEPLETQSFDSFRIVLGSTEEEFSERMVEGFRYMKSIKRSVNEVGDKVDAVGKEVRSNGRKLDHLQETTENGFKKIDRFEENTMNGFKELRETNENGFDRLDQRLSRIDETTYPVPTEIQRMRRLLENGMVRGVGIVAENAPEYTVDEMQKKKAQR